MIKRKRYRLRQGDIIETEEYHFQEGNHGKRLKKKKPTPEMIKKNNAREKEKRCRHRLLEYFNPGDGWFTWTWRKDQRPADRKEALKEFTKAMRKVKREYRKRGKELFWIRNIEKGTKGAWHVHVVINEIGDTASIVSKAWEKGGTWYSEIKKSQYYDEDFSKLAAYLTKDESSVNTRADGTLGKPRLSEASFNHSKNMPLPEPREKKLVRWIKTPKPKKGYRIIKSYEGISAMGYRFRRYTMVRIHRRP